MDKKQTYFSITLVLIGFLLVESSIYIIPYIEGLKELENLSKNIKMQKSSMIPTKMKKYLFHTTKILQ